MVSSETSDMRSNRRGRKLFFFDTEAIYEYYITYLYIIVEQSNNRGGNVLGPNFDELSQFSVE